MNFDSTLFHPGFTKVCLSLFQPPISTVSSNYKLLCLQDYLSITGWMKCEKQSENRQATSADAIMPMADHFLTFILQPVLMAVCHCDTLLFVFMYFTVVWQLKTWLLKAEVLIRLKDSLTFCAALFLSLSIYLCCVCPCQCNILIISLLPLLSPSLSLFLCIFCPISLFLSPYYVYFYQVFSKVCVQDQTSVFVLADAFIQRFTVLLQVNCSFWQTTTSTDTDTHLWT